MLFDVWIDILDLASFVLVTPEILKGRVGGLGRFLQSTVTPRFVTFAFNLPLFLFGVSSQPESFDPVIGGRAVKPLERHPLWIAIGSFGTVLLYAAIADDLWSSGHGWAAPLPLAVAFLALLPVAARLLIWFEGAVRTRGAATVLFWVGAVLFFAARLIALAGHAGWLGRHA